jgi:hypothetical protein
MAKTRVLVSGTANSFALDLAISQSIPEFACNFSETNYDLVSQGKCEFLVMFNHEKNIYRSFISSGGQSEKAILIRLEPDTVFPAQYTKRIESKYGLIISPGAANADGFFLGWPYKYHLNPAEPHASDPDLAKVLDSMPQNSLFDYESWKQRSHKLVMIASNKVSPISQSNYSIRRNLASSIDTEILEVYGSLWNGNFYQKIHHRLAVLVAAIKQGTFPNLLQIHASLFKKYKASKGVIADKHKLLRESKFTLVVENSNFIVTEKIFDAFINGSIPIYVGADLKLFGVPSGLAIESSGNPKVIESIVKNISEGEVKEHLNALQNFVTSEYFLINWPADKVYLKISDRVKKYLDEVNQEPV